MFVTFAELRDALAPLHLNERSHVSTLHDVWKQGAPSPDSIIRNPKGYDPRLRQPGNLEKRLILPLRLAAWIQDVSGKRGMALTLRQALNMIAGEADLGA